MRMNQRLSMALTLGLAVAGAWTVASPAAAQQPAQQSGQRYRVLVPNLDHPKDVDDGFGKDVADDMRKLIEQMPRHQAVSKDELKDNLRKYKLKEEDLDCIKSRQLAVQINAELVMCGEYKPAGGDVMQVTAQFVGAKNGETFEVPAFTASKPEQAAQSIFTAFKTYVNQLQQTAFCSDYLGSQQWSNAREACDKALEINAKSATALYGKARALEEMDSLQQSMEALKKVIQLNPAHQDALRLAGIVAAKLGNSAESLQYFNQYLELNPGDANVRINVANEAAKAGDFEAALAILAPGLKPDSLNRVNPDLLTFEGHWALQAAQKADTTKADTAGRSAHVDSLYQRALAAYMQLYQQQDTATAPSVLGNMLLIMNLEGQSQQAATIGAKLVKAKPGMPLIWSAYADALNATGQYDQALAALDSAQAYDKNNEYPLFAKRGQWLAQRGQLSAAKAAFQQAISRGKLKADVAANLLFGIGYNDKYQKGDKDAALEYFAATRDLAESPETKAMANFWIGLVYYQRGIALAKPGTAAAARKAEPDFEKALTYFNQADAYAQAQPGIRSQLNQMVGYSHKFIDAVNKAKAASRH